VPSGCDRNPHHVRPGGRLQLSGHRLSTGLTVVFAGPASYNRHVNAPLRRTRLGYVVTVPAVALSGRIRVRDARRRSSNKVGPITVLRPPSAAAPAPTGSAFDGNGMWIWQLPKSSGGDLNAIAAQAHAAAINTVFVKSSDGASNYWTQFSTQLVQTLHANGLKVCAWQYVYGTNPAGEANLGAQAVTAGADCLVVDAEKEYEGNYAGAQTYLNTLRSQIGPNYPLGLTSFPYVDYHPGLPYSVFLGPGGAQFDVPQMYWKTIGTSVDQVYVHTFQHNRIYQRPILPLGQTYDAPPPADVVRFRQLAAAYGAPGLSWWDWQETTPAQWSALAQPAPPPVGFVPADNWPALAKGAKGDEVVWLQQHLASYDPTTPTSGTFDATTDQVLRNFQASHALPVTGTTDGPTWQAVLSLPLTPVQWTTTPAKARAARAGTSRRQRAPRSASLPARRYEIPRVG